MPVTHTCSQVHMLSLPLQTKDERGRPRRLPGYFGDWVPPGSSKYYPDAVIRHECLMSAPVVSVKAAEISVADEAAMKWSAGMALRFPRVVSFRADRSVSNVVSLYRIRALYAENNGRLAQAGSGEMGGGDGTGKGKTRKGGARAAGVGTILATFGHTDTSATGVEFDIFHRGRRGPLGGGAEDDHDEDESDADGDASRVAARSKTLAALMADFESTLPLRGTPYNVFVVPQVYDRDGAVASGNDGAGGALRTPLPPEFRDRAALQTLVAKMGGLSVATAVRDLDLAIAVTTADASVQMRIKSDQDVVHPSWLLECWEARQRVPYAPRHMLHASARTAALMAPYADMHLGDEHAVPLGEGPRDTVALLNRACAALKLPSCMHARAPTRLDAGDMANAGSSPTSASGDGGGFGISASLAALGSVSAQTAPRVHTSLDARASREAPLSAGTALRRAAGALDEEDRRALLGHPASLFRDAAPRWLTAPQAPLTKHRPAASTGAIVIDDDDDDDGSDGVVVVGTRAGRAGAHSTAASGRAVGSSSGASKAGAAGDELDGEDPQQVSASPGGRGGSGRGASRSRGKQPKAKRMRKVGGGSDSDAASAASSSSGGYGSPVDSAPAPGRGKKGAGGKAAAAAVAGKRSRRGAGAAMSSPARPAATPVPSPQQQQPSEPAPWEPRGTVAYFDTCPILVTSHSVVPPPPSPGPTMLKLAEARFRLYRGIVSPVLDVSSVNVVVVDEAAAPDRLPQIRAHLAASGAAQRVPVVSHRWVGACIDARAVVPVDQFLVAQK